MTQDSPAAPVPAAFNGNVPAGQQTAQNTTAIAGMLASLPQAIGVMLGQLALSIPAQHYCAACAIARLTWQAAHQGELASAAGAACEAAGLPPGSSVDPVPFLPEQLRPGGSQAIPPLRPSITTVSGTETCAEHIPGQQRGRQLLIAQGSLSPSAMMAFAGS